MSKFTSYYVTDGSREYTSRSARSVAAVAHAWAKWQPRMYVIGRDENDLVATREVTMASTVSASARRLAASSV